MYTIKNKYQIIENKIQTKSTNLNNKLQNKTQRLLINQSKSHVDNQKP